MALVVKADFPVETQGREAPAERLRRVVEAMVRSLSSERTTRILIIHATANNLQSTYSWPASA